MFTHVLLCVFASPRLSSCRFVSFRLAGRRSSFTKSRKDYNRSVYDGDTVKEGALDKRTTGMVKRWQSRYFMITGHYLKYFEDEKKTKTKGVIDLSDLLAVTPDAANPEGTTFCLALDDAEVTLRGPKTEVDEWIAALQTFLPEPADDAGGKGKGEEEEEDD